ncbi:hypothetical protein ACQKQD_03635 [Methylobacterium sp. NPDC080182]|uniref:hypothetical protein n=1 Tax=Methylobacterium sp. NPDC080182 TaxID=3390590 RepID=UPI003CFBD72C
MAPTHDLKQPNVAVYSQVWLRGHEVPALDTARPHVEAPPHSVISMVAAKLNIWATWKLDCTQNNPIDPKKID